MMIEDDSLQPDAEQISEGHIVEWDQNQWWLDGKTRVKNEKHFFRTKKGLLIIICAFVLTVTMVVLLLSRRESPSIVDEDFLEDDFQQELTQTSLQEQIKKLRSQLEKADPAIKETPLPQVEMNVQIELGEN